MHNALHPACLAGTPLRRYFHACAFVHGRKEEHRLLVPFVSEAISAGERVVYIVDPALREDHLGHLAAAAADLGLRDGQMEVRTWPDTYLRDGRFDPELTIRLVQDTIRDGQEQGFPRSRLIGQMGWAFEDHPGVDQLIEYEARIDEVLARTRSPGVCVYDLDRLSGETMMDLLRTHPLTILRGRLYENPFFTPPEMMLKELRARRGAQTSAAH